MKRIALAFAVLLPATVVADDGSSIVDASARGIALWNKSCRSPDALGACISVKTQTVSNRCSAQVETVSRVKRSRRAKKARTLLARAVDAADKQPKAATQAETARAVAAARFYLAESKFEELSALQFPAGLSFSPDRPKRAEKSKRRFMDYLSKSKTLVDECLAAYSEVAGDTNASAEHRIAATARVGQAYRRFALNLQGAPVPVDVRTGKFARDATDAYCDTLWEQARPLVKAADAAFDRCAELAKESGVDNAWSKTCASATVNAGVLDETTAARYASFERVRFMSCARKAGFKGKVSLEFEVRKGKAHNLLAHGVPDKKLHNCLKKVIDSVEFPGGAGTVAVTLPLTFR